MRPRRSLVLLALAAGMLSGCGIVHVHLGSKQSEPGHGGGALLPQQTIVLARPLRAAGPDGLRVGSQVGRDFTGVRSFLNASDGFAIGTPAAKLGDTYPLATTDGGRTWRTAGPVLHIPAAQGAVAVAQEGMISPRTWFACCGLNAVVDVTPDAGRHWWQAFLPGMVVAVYAGTGPCEPPVAVVEPYVRSGPAPLWTYVSATGRRWAYARSPSSAPSCRAS